MAYLPIATPLVGRVAELTALAARLDEAEAGHGSVALITGVPGIGKSRLAGEVRDLAARRGLTLLWGRSFEGEGARSFTPWGEALGGYARELERDRLQQQLGQHAAVVAQIVPGIHDALPELAAPPSRSPSEDRLRLFDAVVHFVLSAAHERPMLLVLDDLQWADRASLALMRHLARHVADSAILVLGTFREEEAVAGHPLAELVPMLRREAPYQEVALRDLTRTDSSTLVDLVLERSSTGGGAATLDDVLATALVSLTGGNPFYIQELVKDLVDTGQLVRRRDSWIAVSPPAAWDVPREVRDVIERRVRRLPASAQRLLHAACACTAGFSFADARALTNAQEEALLDSIDAALRAHLLRVAESAAAPARYDFAHALIRHTLYASLNPDRRARLHLQTAESLERGQATDELAGTLAMHYRLAGPFAAPERCIGFAIRAGEVAQAGFAYEDAVTHWQSALDLMEVHTVDPERRAALLERLGDQMWITDPGDERGVTCHEQALALYEGSGQGDSAARVHFRLTLLFGGTSSERQDIPRALHHARAAATFMPSTERSVRRAHLEAQLSMLGYFGMQLQTTLAASQRAMRITDELDDELTRLIVSVYRGFCLTAAGELSAGLALITEGSEIANRLNVPYFAGVASIWAGIVRFQLLDPVDARHWCEAEFVRPRTANSPVQRQLFAFWIARARLMMGDIVELPGDLPADGLFRATLEAASAHVTADWPACRAAATIALDLARRRGNRYAESWAAHQLARLALAEDDATSAEDLLERSLELVAGQHRPYEALVHADLAVLYASQRRTDEARAALNRCRASMAQNEDWRGLAGRLALGEAALAAAEGRTTPAHAHFTEAIAVFRRYRLPWDEAQALECWGATLITSGDRKAGDRRLDAAATLYRRHGAGRRWLERVARIRAAARQGYAAGAQVTLPQALSHREVEVLCLVAAGRSNQEIADALVLSVRTVERHLGHVYDKLGASGKSARAVATAYGIANGLVPAPVA